MEGKREERGREGGEKERVWREGERVERGRGKGGGRKKGEGGGGKGMRGTKRGIDREIENYAENGWRRVKDEGGVNFHRLW